MKSNSVSSFNWVYRGYIFSRKKKDSNNPFSAPVVYIHRNCHGGLFFAKVTRGIDNAAHTHTHTHTKNGWNNWTKFLRNHSDSFELTKFLGKNHRPHRCIKTQHDSEPWRTQTRSLIYQKWSILITDLVTLLGEWTFHRPFWGGEWSQYFHGSFSLILRMTLGEVKLKCWTVACRFNTQGTLQEGFVTELIILKVCHKKGNLKANIAKYWITNSTSGITGFRSQS